MEREGKGLWIVKWDVTGTYLPKWKTTYLDVFSFPKKKHEVGYMVCCVFYYPINRAVNALSRRIFLWLFCPHSREVEKLSLNQDYVFATGAPSGLHLSASRGPSVAPNWSSVVWGEPPRGSMVPSDVSHRDVWRSILCSNSTVTRKAITPARIIPQDPRPGDRRVGSATPQRPPNQG